MEKVRQFYWNILPLQMVQKSSRWIHKTQAIFFFLAVSIFSFIYSFFVIGVRVLSFYFTSPELHQPIILKRCHWQWFQICYLSATKPNVKRFGVLAFLLHSAYWIGLTHNQIKVLFSWQHFSRIDIIGLLIKKDTLKRKLKVTCEAFTIFTTIFFL